MSLPSAMDRRGPAARFLAAARVFLQPRVLIVLFLGFSSGLPLALSGSTLAVRMADSGVDLGTIGLFGLQLRPAYAATGEGAQKSYPTADQLENWAP